MTNTNKPHYQRVKVTYHGKGWHGFRTKAYLHLIDNGSEVHDVYGKSLSWYEVFHYKNATVMLDTFLDEAKMRAGLEFIAERDARKTAQEFMNAVKADPAKYRIEDIADKVVSR